MLNRDFTKTNKDYFKKNKVWLISIVAVIIVGVLFAVIFGMNSNFELKGYYEFSVSITEKTDASKCSDEIKNIVNSYGANFDSVAIVGEGDTAEIIVRYMDQLSEEKQAELNAKIVAELGEDVTEVENHIFVKKIVKSTDYIFTACAILIMLALTCVFAYFRYNGASAITILLTSVVGTLLFMSVGSILRLSVGMSYFAMLVILNMLLIYKQIDLFENMRNESWLGSKDYSQALSSAMKNSRFKQTFVCVATSALGLLMVLFATSPIKYVSINVIFMAVVLLVSLWYIVPFVWSVFITKCNVKPYKVKVDKNNNLED